MSDRTVALELNGDFKIGKVIKQLITIEYQRILYSTIKHYFNPSKKYSILPIKEPLNTVD